MIIISITVYRLWIFHSGICNYKTKDPSQVSLPTKGTQSTPSFEEISKSAQNHLPQVEALCDFSKFTKCPCVATVEA